MKKLIKTIIALTTVAAVIRANDRKISYKEYLRTKEKDTPLNHHPVPINASFLSR